MYWPSIFDLKQFYASRLGQLTCRVLRARLREHWDNAAGDLVLGIGYAAPYLLPFLDEASRVFALMPAAQGVAPWPAGRPNLSLLAEEAELPFPEGSVDRVLIIHALEHTEQAQGMMREVWRVLSPGGRLLIAVPNRRGLWSRFETTPFGVGQPYSPGQIARLLNDAQFTVLDTHAALYAPPNASPLVLRFAPAIERLGKSCLGLFGGVLIVEAEKQVYALPRNVSTPRERTRLLQPAPVAQPV